MQTQSKTSSTKTSSAKTSKKNTIIAIAVASLALAGGATYALWPKNTEKMINELAKKSPEEIRKAVDSGSVPREVAWEAFGQQREQEFQKRLDSFFALKTDGERDKYLDKMIDEMEARRKEFEARAATRPAGDRWGGRPRDGGPTTRPNDANRAEREKRMAARQDATPPEKRAQRAEFMVAMRKRMQERGMQVPEGGRGGFGMMGGFGGGGPRGGGDRGGQQGGQRGGR